ncbi:MAG: toll/interleukin-1 receptor domain-containing protein [Ilumatobacteraceae bacterium]
MRRVLGDAGFGDAYASSGGATARDRATAFVSALKRDQIPQLFRRILDDQSLTRNAAFDRAIAATAHRDPIAMGFEKPDQPSGAGVGVDHEVQTVPHTGAPAQVFISHAHHDTAIVDHLVDLLQTGAGASAGNIFCTSIDGLGVPNGQDFVAYIGDALSRAPFVLCVMTRAYLQSSFCMFELGALWIQSTPVFVLLDEDIGFDELPVILGTRQSGRLSDGSALDQLATRTIQGLSLQELNLQRWNKKKEAFLTRLAAMSQSGIN